MRLQVGIANHQYGLTAIFISSVRVKLFENFVANGRVLNPQQHDNWGIGGHLRIWQRVGHAQERDILGSHGVELERSERNVEEDVAQVCVGTDQQTEFFRRIITILGRGSDRLDEQVA